MTKSSLEEPNIIMFFKIGKFPISGYSVLVSHKQQRDVLQNLLQQPWSPWMQEITLH